jgi:signal peptidase
MFKNIIIKVVNGISVCVIICAVLVLLNVVTTSSGEAPSIFGYSIFRVMTGSMEPTIPTDALIITQKTPAGDLSVGDVISFYSRDPALSGSVNTHRIVAIEQDGNQYYFTTKGDANNVDDIYTTLEEDLIGRVVYSSVVLGKAVRLLSNPLIFIPVILVPLGLMLVINLYQTVKIAKSIAREEEEQAVREALEEIRKKKEANQNQMAGNMAETEEQAIDAQGCTSESEGE